MPNLERLLTFYPNQTIARYLFRGFTYGFDIGYRGPLTHGACRNLISANDHADAVNEAISKEVSRGHTVGPFDTPPFPILHISPLGAVPKKDGTYRLIMDMSSPRGEAINEGINKEEFSVQYTPFDEATSLVAKLGTGCFMAKIDIKHAFRICPVNPADFPLLGMWWDNKFYVDTRLPFGSRSSPYIFNTFADVLCWFITVLCGIATCIHYLDDFFVVAKTETECKRYVETIKKLFDFLGIPIALDKLEGPANIIAYLGIQIDSIKNILQVPPDKLSELLSLLNVSVHKKACKKRDLLSLIGKLSFVSKVIKPGRLFLRKLINLSTTVKELHHFVKISEEVRDDLRWWLAALHENKGVCFIMEPFETSLTLQLFTDASGVGFGAVFGNRWFSQKWPSEFLRLLEKNDAININARELFAVCVLVEVWGPLLLKKQVKLFCDNETTCNIWRNHKVKDKILLILLRRLYFDCVKFNTNILLTHIPGFKNIYADLLSRLQVTKFLQMMPSADCQPTQIPASVWTI